MYKYVSIAATGLALIGCACTTDHDKSWDKDCQRNYSTNSREFDECKAKVEAQAQFEAEAGTVNVDPKNTERVGLEDVGVSKGKTSQN